MTQRRSILIERLGQSDAQRVVDAYGGTRLAVPSRLSSATRIALTLGDTLAARLVIHFGDTRLAIPVTLDGPGGARTPIDIGRIKRLSAKGWSAAQIARHLHCSELVVHRKRAILRTRAAGKPVGAMMNEDCRPMSEQPDDAGLAKMTPETARTAPLACDGYVTSEDAVSAPSDRIFPSHEAYSVGLDVARRTADTLGRAGLWIGSTGTMRGATIDGNEVSRQIRRLIADARKLADVETERDALRGMVDRKNARIRVVEGERDELAAKVEALSQPRVFNVAGLVDADLAERYESLRAERDGMIATGHVLEDNLAELAGKLEHVEAERDAAAENARQERDIAVGLYGVLSHQTELVDRLANAVDREANDIGGESALSVLQLLGPHLTEAHDALKAAVHRKPRCRVVTSPRFYSNEQGSAAWNALASGMNDEHGPRRIIDAVAQGARHEAGVMTDPGGLSAAMRVRLGRIAIEDPPGLAAFEDQTLAALFSRGLIERTTNLGLGARRRPYLWTITQAGKDAIA